MDQLYLKFKFKEENFTADEIKKVKQEILRLSEKLKPLEEEILSHPNGILYIGKSMAVIIDGFNDDLKRSISRLI